ncbi:MAG: penicillin-binding protein 2 [Planctomycetes bacterium]|nr:penicillin-binding protein 2 [Planctomycetota bacterium]
MQLHLSSGPDFERVAQRQRVVRETIPARPGEIVDRHGHVFATSVNVRSVYIVPRQIREAWDVARRLGEALDISPDALFERIASHPDKQFLWIKRRITEAEVERVRSLKLPPNICGFREEFLRQYPQGPVAAQVIGIRNIDGVGQGGVEQTLDQLLRGQAGYRELEQDARGRVIAVHTDPEHAPQHGQTVVLTIDTVIQVYAERALDSVMEQWKPQSASAIVLDPQTGDILAMASRPTFDPNQPQHAAADAWKNRAIADMYEPGSTFKPFVVAWALTQGVIQPDEVFHCENGEYRMGRRVLHDHHRYGPLSVADILVKSSNIGMAKIGQRLGNKELFKAATAFGFGGRTGIELPGELPGQVRPLKQWNLYSTGSVPMGQELAATPLQIITAFAALANGGTLMTPRLIVHDDDEANRSHVRLVSRVVDAQAADWVRREALAAVVTRGTGKKAAISGYEIFGKTGTAQKQDPKTGLYSRELHMSSFVCGGPVDNPRALVLISVDQPSVSVAGEHFGGSVAAPAAGELLHHCLTRLKVPPNGKLIRSALLPDDFREQFIE